MYIDYAILGLLSAAMIIYAFLRRPGGSESSDDDHDGGVPTEGDSSPTETPPALHVPPTEDQPKEPAEA